MMANDLDQLVDDINYLAAAPGRAAFDHAVDARTKQPPAADIGR
jgi:hypothetical protein